MAQLGFELKSFLKNVQGVTLDPTCLVFRALNTEFPSVRLWRTNFISECDMIMLSLHCLHQLQAYGEVFFFKLIARLPFFISELPGVFKLNLIFWDQYSSF
jgi:hypothetical protein